MRTDLQMKANNNKNNNLLYYCTAVVVVVAVAFGHALDDGTLV